jgi:hypothetical protein
MPNPRFCHFCGRSDSLHPVPDTTKYICSLCWEIIVHVMTKWKEITDQVLLEKSDEQPN